MFYKSLTNNNLSLVSDEKAHHVGGCSIDITLISGSFLSVLALHPAILGCYLMIIVVLFTWVSDTTPL